MKKRAKQTSNLRVILIIIGILILTITAFLLIKTFTGKAIDIDSQIEKIPQNPDEAKEVSTAYLKQEWTKILQNNKVGRAILAVSNTLYSLSPVFKILIGAEYSLSWYFFLCLGVWIAIIILIYGPTKTIFPEKQWIGFIIAIIITTIGAQFGAITKPIEMIMPLFTNPWIIVGSVVIAALILYLYSAFMKQFGETLKQKDKKEAEERREQKAETVEKIHDIEIKAAGGK